MRWLIWQTRLLFLRQEPNILAWIFEKLVIAMIVYFLLSIINSMAQAYAKRLDERKRQSQKPAKGEWTLERIYCSRIYLPQASFLTPIRRHSEYLTLWLVVAWRRLLFKKRLRKTRLCCDFLSTPCHDCRITTALHQRLNPLNPNSSMLILHTVLYIFLKVLKGRICLPIKNFFRWWSFPLFSWPQCLIQTDIVWRN